MRGLFIKAQIFLLVLGFAQFAEAKFPKRPLKILVYTKPGGAIDVFARKFESIARKYTDAKILIVNKPGAGGIIALKKIVSARADGHLIGAVTKSNIGKIVSSKSNLKVNSFDWLAMMVSDPEAIITQTNGPLKDWNLVLEEAKKKKGKQLWAGPAKGGNDHIMAMKTWKKTGISAKWIPYQGGGKAMAALMGGHASVYVGNPGDVIGKPALKVVAISSKTRLKGSFKDIPTFEELGVKNFDSEIMWRGFITKKGIPAEAKTFWMNLFEKVSNDSQWKEYIETRGATAKLVKDNDFLNLVNKDHAEFTNVLREMKLL